MIDDGTVAIRLVLAALAGAALGFERELRDRPAGLRTHILVAAGSALFALVSAYGFHDVISDSRDLNVGQGAPVRADVTRVASQIVVGIGFIGAGTIIRYRGRVRGLTTAASLWIAAAAGLAAGLGFWTGVGVAVGISIVSLVVLRPVEARLARKQSRGAGNDWETPLDDIVDEDEDGDDTGGPGGAKGDRPG